MLLVTVSGMFVGTFVDRHLRRTLMLLSSVVSFVAFALAGLVYLVAQGLALRDLTHPAFWAFIVLILGLVATILALRSRQYRELSDRYTSAPDVPPPEAGTPAPAA